MPKVADIKLSWVRSPSADLTSRRITITRNGEETVLTIPVNSSEYMIEVPANSNVSFKTTVFDTEGKQVESSLYQFTIGDLEDPLPDTDLLHEVVAVRDVEPTPGPFERR